MSAALTDDVIRAVVGDVPDEMLESPAVAADFPSAAAARDRYAGYLITRLQGPRDFVAEAGAAQARIARMPVQRVQARR